MTVAVILVKGFPYVALQHLCHRSVSGAPDGGDLLEKRNGIQRHFQVLFPEHQSDPDYGNPSWDLFLFRVLGIAYLTALYFLYYREYYIKINTYPTML